jgi:PPM family protein phosphatase
VRNPGSHATFGDPNAQFGDLTNHLASAVRRANRVIWDAAQHHATQRGMGATVVAVLLRPPMISITHVGDSRIYLLRDSQLQQLTQDHSLVMEQVRRGLITREEAERNEMRNIIVRALGADENVEVDMDELCIAPGDRLVLCSDGLTSMLNDEGIAQVVSEAATTEQACERLVQIANDHGGDDNVTVIVLRVMEPRPRGFWGWFKRLWQ